MIDITSTPIQTLVESIGYDSMQTYVWVMIILVAVMTVADMIHKKSATYFFQNSEKAQADVKKGLADGNSNCTIGTNEGRFKELTAGDKMGIAVKTVAVDVVGSGEFKNPVRRLVHLLTMYGFVLFNLATAMMIFGSDCANATWTQVWNVGAIMLFIGSWWFWFVFKVDVAAEGNTWTSIEIRRDMFSLSLMATSTTALGWSMTGGGTGVWFSLLILSTASLFGGVYWSKFSHMFFKPMAAYNKRIIKADGSNENLPHETRDDEWQQNRHSMELLKDAPMNFGLGIKREPPNHY